jgi:hypothetical protein
MAAVILRRSTMALLAACLTGAAPFAEARTVEYALDLPAEQMLSYRLEFEVAHPGSVTFDADWSPHRVLVFRVERPGETPFRRSGPPPQRFDLEVDPEDLDPEGPWTLVVSGLPSRQAAEGRLVIELPDSTRSPNREEPRATPEPAVREAGPWTQRVATPGGLTHAHRRLYRATERFREIVVDATDPDDYRWQDGMLRFLADRRDRPAAQTPLVERPTQLMLERIIEAVGQLDQLRLSKSEPLVGPAPTDPLARRAWLAVRDPRFEPVEEELGALLHELHRGHAPELENELWFSSFLSCLIVCERHFEESARLGGERATNRELVQRQWDRVLAAVDALDALTDI